MLTKLCLGLRLSSRQTVGLTAAFFIPCESRVGYDLLID